ncbi:MAG: DNA-directed RNA polymerase subunit delta [Turicibacter sp.]|nr:DNA-directed RNA polymerase subunit delta [Turicibacter sp.]
MYNEEMSMLEVAEQLIQRKIKPQKFDKIAKEVCEIMGISAEEFDERVAQFYTDLTLSGKFVTVGEDKWDLKSRQKYDVANYDTYDISFDDEELIPVENDFDVIADADADDDFEEEEKETEDSYDDESSPELPKEESDTFEGLNIYSEEELE